jgi:hypothetical protein
VLQRRHQEELDRLSAQLRDVGDERRRGGSLCFSTCRFACKRRRWRFCVQIMQRKTLFAVELQHFALCMSILPWSGNHAVCATE